MRGLWTPLARTSPDQLVRQTQPAGKGTPVPVAPLPIASASVRHGHASPLLGLVHAWPELASAPPAAEPVL